MRRSELDVSKANKKTKNVLGIMLILEIHRSQFQIYIYKINALSL